MSNNVICNTQEISPIDDKETQAVVDDKEKTKKVKKEGKTKENMDQGLKVANNGKDSINKNDIKNNDLRGYKSDNKEGIQEKKNNKGEG